MFGGVADDVAVELEEFAESAALLFFVSEEGGRAEPLHGFFELAFFGDDHASEGGGHFWAERDVSIAFVDEVEELSEEFAAAFFLIDLDGFEGWSVVFGESVAGCGFSPVFEDVVLFRTIVGVEVAEAGKRVHGMRGGSLVGVGLEGERFWWEIGWSGAAEMDDVFEELECLLRGGEVGGFGWFGERVPVPEGFGEGCRVGDPRDFGDACGAEEGWSVVQAESGVGVQGFELGSEVVLSEEADGEDGCLGEVVLPEGEEGWGADDDEFSVGTAAEEGVGCWKAEGCVGQRVG